MKNKKSTIFSFCLLLLLCWSCQDPASSPELRAPRLAFDSTCVDGDSSAIDLEPIPAAERRMNSPVAHRVNVAAHPYDTDDCLCYIRDFRFEFTDLPKEIGLIQVEDKAGDGIEFSIDSTGFGPNKAVMIPQPGNIPDSGMDVYIWVDLEDYDPGFVRATGLCIIDNLQGSEDPIPDPSVTLVKPLKVPTAGPNNGPVFFRPFIPVAATDEL